METEEFKKTKRTFMEIVSTVLKQCLGAKTTVRASTFETS